MQLVLKPDGINYIKVLPLYDFEIPEEKEGIEIARAIFEELQRDGQKVIVYNHPRKNYRIGVYTLNQYVYLVQSVGQHKNFYMNTVYVADDKHINDFLKIAKYLESLYYNGNSIPKNNRINTRCQEC